MKLDSIDLNVENYSINELVDNCLAKNKQRTVFILNENNFSFEDSIIIIRTFLIKSKRLLKLTQNFLLKLPPGLENSIPTSKRCFKIRSRLDSNSFDPNMEKQTSFISSISSAPYS